MRKYSFLITLMSLSILTTSYGQSKIKAIKAGTFIDVVNGKTLKNQTILVDNTIIIDIGTNLIFPKDAEIIDLSNATVLPGLIDCHTHMTAEPSNDYYGDIFRKTAVDYALRAPIYAKHTPQQVSPPFVIWVQQI